LYPAPPCGDINYLVIYLARRLCIWEGRDGIFSGTYDVSGATAVRTFDSGLPYVAAFDACLHRAGALLLLPALTAG
jgi:hypothetical protein